MAATETLWQLQGIDTQIDEAETRIAAVRAELRVADEVEAARADLADKRLRSQALDRKQRDSEWDVADRSTKITTLDKKLYSGTITSSKELTGLQTEIVHMREALGEIEEQALQTMTDAEAARAALVVSEATAVDAELRWKARQSTLKAEGSALTKRLAVLKPERSPVADALDGRVLARYDELRRTRRGVGIARIERNVCLGCRTDVPTARVQQARLGELVNCSSCGRFLYPQR